MMNATYSPDDNKLRLYSSTRLDAEIYARVKAAGFKWAPKQDLFVAPMWTPQREDLLIELCGEIDDEDTSLVDRAEQRAERFETYSEKRAADADRARAAVAAIADNIPFGQPILVGHHSERHARRDAEKIQTGMRKAVRMWETSNYWTDRAAGRNRGAKVVCVEINHALATALAAREFPTMECDFLEFTGQTFDRIVMNPPFERGADIAHVRHAMTLLKPGGRLVAICANGPRQREQLMPLAEASGGTWEDLPADSFKASGTSVNTALLVIESDAYDDDDPADAPCICGSAEHANGACLRDSEPAPVVAVGQLGLFE